MYIVCHSAIGQIQIIGLRRIFGSQCIDLFYHRKDTSKAKQQGFSDFQIARAIGYEGDMENGSLYVRKYRGFSSSRISITRSNVSSSK